MSKGTQAIQKAKHSDHESRVIQVNRILQNSSVVVLGAGFSVAATDGKLPLMSTFFDRLNYTEFPLLYDFVLNVCGEPSEANVERLLTALEQIRTSPLDALNGWGYQWNINAASIYNQLTTYALNRLKPCLDISKDNWAANLLYDFNRNSVIISMNYDNIAERILSCRDGIVHGNFHPTCHHCKMRLLTIKGCSCSGKQELIDDDWRGSIIKPHGSISWKRCLNSKCCSYQCMVADAHCRPFEPCICPVCSESCSPVLVMPTLSKNLSETPEIGIMWNAAWRAVADAESILLFGFSLPASDELLLQLIRSAVCKTRKLRRMGSIDLNPGLVIDRFKQSIPRDLEIEYEQFLVVPGLVPEWLS